MEAISIYFLVFYNFLFFWKFYQNPYLNMTSEISTTFYPHWHWIGRMLQQGKLPFKDNIYYRYPACISFLSTMYPPHFLSSLTKSFKVLQWNILGHYMLGSILAYLMFLKWCSLEVALFGAITLTYSGYCIKIQQPCITYTLAWIPGIFFDGWLGAICMAMTFYGGYYPILIYLLPFILIIHPFATIVGMILALPQLIPFIWYFKNSVRWKSLMLFSHGFGKVPVRKLSELILPLRPTTHTNDVMFMEMAMYMSLIPFLFIWFSHSKFWYVLAFGLIVSVGLLPSIERIPARALYIVTLALTILATDGLYRLNLSNEKLGIILLLQSVLLLFNRDIYPCFPFSQWWSKKANDFTGYLKGKSHGFYKGAFRLA